MSNSSNNSIHIDEATETASRHSSLGSFGTFCSDELKTPGNNCQKSNLNISKEVGKKMKIMTNPFGPPPSMKLQQTSSVNQVKKDSIQFNNEAKKLPVQNKSEIKDKKVTGRTGTIWGLGPIQSRMTQNALGDNFVNQFHDNSNKSQTVINQNTIDQEKATNLQGIKADLGSESNSLFGSYLKKMYTGTSNQKQQTFSSLTQQKVPAGNRLVDGELEKADNMYPQEALGGERMFLEGGAGGRNLEMSQMTQGLRECGGNYSVGGVYGMEFNSNLIGSGFGRTTEVARSRADEEFSFRMGLMDRVRGTMQNAPSQMDFTNNLYSLEGSSTLEEINEQKQRSLIELQQLEQAQRMMEVKNRQEYWARKGQKEEDRQFNMQKNANMQQTSGDDDKINELKKEVEMLKKQMNSSNGSANKESKDANVPSSVFGRLGVTAKFRESNESQRKSFNRLDQNREDKLDIGEPVEIDEEKIKARRKRFGQGSSLSNPNSGNFLDKSFFVNEKHGKKRKYENTELPTDLVLTELSNEGPVPAKPSGGIPRDLVLTEFGEKGPVKITSEMDKLEARPSKMPKRN